MRHLLHDPAFPDIVGAWATTEAASPANDNDGERPELDDINDPLLLLLARIEVAATRLW